MILSNVSHSREDWKIEIKATEHYVSEVLFVMLYKGVLTFKSVNDQNLVCAYTNVFLYLNKKVEDAKRQNHRQEDGSCETDRNNGTKNAAERP